MQNITEALTTKLNRTLRYILFEVFQIEANAPSLLFINHIIPPKDLPRLFLRKSYPLSTPIDSIISETIELLEQGNLFSSYKPT